MENNEDVENENGYIFDESKYDDPFYEYILVTKLQPYLKAVRAWWKNYENMHFDSTGVLPIELDGIECPPGLFMRMTNTPVRSPIKNVQAFPFVPTAYLQLTGIPGGVSKMVTRVCNKNEFIKLEEFIIIEKHNLPSTYHKGQFIAFIPEDVYNNSRELGKYVYLTRTELQLMSAGVLPKAVMCKCAQYAFN